MQRVRPQSAPVEGEPLSVCPHCWNVNIRAARLCARCGADMAMALQESGGLRFWAPVQSPLPVRAAGRLSRLQRAAVAGIVALLGLASLAGAWGGIARPAAVPPHAAAGR